MSEQKFFAASKANTTRRDDDGGRGQGQGLSKRLYVGRQGGSGRRNYNAFIEFAADWTNVLRIESAWLVGYTDDYGLASDFSLPANTDTPKATVKRLTAAFDDGSSPDGTWAGGDYTNPASTSSDAVVIKPSHAAQELFRFNITEIVEDFAPKTVQRHDSGVGSFVTGTNIVRVGIFGTTNAGENWSMLSDKFADATFRPRIELNYTLGATTPDVPTNLSPSGSVTAIGAFQGDFTDTKASDTVASAQVQVYSGGAAATVAITDIVTSAGHGLVNGSPIYFSSLTGGTGLATFTKYYVVSKTTDTFKVSTTLNGTAVNVTVAYTAATWRTLLWDSGAMVTSTTEKVNARFNVVPDFPVPVRTSMAWRGRVTDNESLTSAWTSLVTFTVTNTDPNAPTTTPANASSYATLDGVLFRGNFTDPDVGDTLIAYQVQMSAYDSGAAQWNDPAYLLWDTGKTYTGSGVTTWERNYGGSPLTAGTYHWRARVWDDHDGVSAWTYKSIVLTADFVADPEQAGQVIKMRPRAPWRIVIKAMGTLRGPGAVVAILDNAKKPGASLMWNSPGEAHWTLPVDHPQISVIEPKQTHYSIQFYTGDGWREKFAGLVWDFDANERDVVFYGIDYLALWDYVMDERYDPGNPDKAAGTGLTGGSKYVSKTITQVVTGAIDYALAVSNSPVGFITRGSIATMAENVTIFATMVPTLQLITGLLESHRAGQDKRTRVQVRPKTGGGYEIIVQDAPGVVRTNLRLRYGELVQGFRTIAFGSNWATRINGIGRQRDGLKVNYEKGTGLLDESVYGRFAKATVVNDIEDRLDLKRRVRQMAVSAGMLGQQLGLGLRSGLLGPRDGYDVTDQFPVSIQHGAVNTDNFGHNGLWVCLGVTWEGDDNGNQHVILTLRPPDGGSAPSASLLDSLEISPQAEWQLGWTAPTVVRPTSKYWLDQNTGKVYIRDGYGVAVSITGTA